MPETDTVSTTVSQAFQTEWSRSVSYLLRLTGDPSMAEECVQAAFETALTNWEKSIPDNPGAWIRSVARNRFIDVTRSQKSHSAAHEAIGHETESAVLPDDESPDKVIADDELALMFLCCHPAIGRTDQVVLMLRLVAGLTPAEIAPAFFVREDAIRSRLLRAKRKIQAAGIPTGMPPPEAIPDRITQVMAAIYLAYNEAYLPSRVDASGKTGLVHESIRLCVKLCELAADNPEVHGLMAMILFTEARRPARLVDGQIRTLENQDRSRWDPYLREAGKYHLARAHHLGTPGRYTLQAQISGLHSNAPSFEQTDWAAIVTSYDQLCALEPNSVYELNRLAARSFTEPLPGLITELQQWEQQFGQTSYSVSMRADLLRRLGQIPEAIHAYEQAIEAADSPASAAFLKERLDELQQSGPQKSGH